MGHKAINWANNGIWDHYASMSWWKQSTSDGTVSIDCYKTSYKLIRTWRKASKICFHSPFRTFFPCVLHKNSRKPQRRPISPNRSCAKIMKINRQWPKSNQFWISGYTSIPNSLPSLPYVRHKMPGKPKFQPFRYDKVAHKVEKSTDQNTEFTANLPCILHKMPGKLFLGGDNYDRRGQGCYKSVRIEYAVFLLYAERYTSAKCEMCPSDKTIPSILPKGKCFNVDKCSWIGSGDYIDLLWWNNINN